MKTNCIVLSDSDLADVRKEMTQIQRIVQSATASLAVLIRTNAPRKTGNLIKGIVPSPWEENSAHPGKIVRQVYMDAGMNDTFVKVTKSGKRYYYPASQEFGFRIARRSTSFRGNTPTRSAKVPGKFFMRDTFIAYVPGFVSKVDDFVGEVTGK